MFITPNSGNLLFFLTSATCYNLLVIGERGELKRMQIIESLQSKSLDEVNTAKNKEDLEKIRVQYLGKQGELTTIIKLLATVPNEEKPKLGQAINVAKKTLQEAINSRAEKFQALKLAKQLEREKIDVTLSGSGQKTGSFHPITTSLRQIESIFTQMGFVIEQGPEIENNHYNFEALNIPEYHPARTMHDTFYLGPDSVLRTHTSGVQIRMMEKHQPPIQMISPGRVYRCDSDITHTPMFHQIEGLWVDQSVSFADLKGLLQAFLSAFFNKKVNTRFRPSYFPFTEPSAEIDIACVICQAKGCAVCKETGWLEVLGCGMVHPNVLEKSGVDPKTYQGFAFGMGIERLAMLRYGIDDLRLFFENNLRFLQQF